MPYVKTELTEEDQLKNAKRAGMLSREIALLEVRRKEVGKKLKTQIEQHQMELDMVCDEMRTGIRMEKTQGEMFDPDNQTDPESTEARLEQCRAAVRLKREEMAGIDD